MKKIFSIIIILMVFTLSCNDDFTTITPQGSLGDETLQNQGGVNLLLTGAYGLLDGVTPGTVGNEWWGAGDNWWLEVISDNAHKGSTDGDQAPLFALQTFNWNASNPYLLGKWLALYGGVDRTNAVINLANSIEGADVSAQVAEARFLRGHFHFELQRLFVNVPFISEDDISDPNKPNEGPIWDEIEADFQFAIDNLPETQPVAGRATSWAAKSYLGKVHLYQEEWSDALLLFNDVITAGPYSLDPNYVNNFNFAGKNGPESIFAIQFAVNDGATNNSNGNQGGTLNFPGALGFCCGFFQPSQDLVNAFQTDASGLPLLDTYNQTDVSNDQGADAGGCFELSDPDDPMSTCLSEFSMHSGNLDPRLDYTVGRRGIDYNGYGPHPGVPWVRAQVNGGPYLPKKNVYQSSESGSQGTGAWGQQFPGINYNVIRFADVLLMGAEAAVEQNELGTALEYINRVRSRAKTSSHVQDPNGGDAANYEVEPYPTLSGQDFARKAVRFERRLELGMEGHRLFDLRRWKIAVEVMNEFFENESRILPNIFLNTTYEGKHNMFPIPINAIDLSEGVLKQNDNF